MLKGHSHFKIDLIDTNIGFLVKKSTISNSIRLQKQCEKQEQFRSFLQKNPKINSDFEIPLIIQKDDKGKYFITDFYRGKTILDIFEIEDITILDTLIKKLLNFLDWEFDNCVYHKDISAEILTKLKSLNNKVDKDIQKLIKLFINKLPKTIQIPVGICHGDLTLSNCIFTNKIILIDFLDVFIETPLQDIGKLLQELELEWSFLLDNHKRDITKIKIGYEYLRQRLCSLLRDYSPFSKIFYIITLFRLFPYIEDKLIYNVVKSKLEKELL